MALNVQTFKTRATTAVAFAAVMLAGLLWSHWSFFLLFTVIHFGCWVEFQRLAGLIHKPYKDIKPLHKYGVMAAGWFFMLYMTNNAYTIGRLRLDELGWFLLLASGVLLPLSLIIVDRKFGTENLALSVLGLVYISVSWGLMINIRTIGLNAFASHVFEDNGWKIPIILIASIWINDTMAYIMGSFIGKTPFSKISPKKTWEGTVGGAILCVAVVSFVGAKVFPEIGMVPMIVISSIAAVMGTIGDLLESKFKRMAGVKDSGSIMPGHGGFLDRFDSLLLATPFVWLYLFVFPLG